MAISEEYKGLIKHALDLCSRSSEYTATGADQGKVAFYERLFMDCMRSLLAEYSDLFSIRDLLTQEDPSLVAQFGNGWCRLPADFLRFEPDTVSAELNTMDTGEKIARIAGLSLKYVCLPKDINAANEPRITYAVLYEFLYHLIGRDISFKSDAEWIIPFRTEALTKLATQMGNIRKKQKYASRVGRYAAW